MHLYYLIELYGVFHIIQLCKLLQIDFKYIAYIFEFINYIIIYFIDSKIKAYMLLLDTSLAFFDELNLSFIFRLDINLNAITKSC